MQLLHQLFPRSHHTRYPTDCSDTPLHGLVSMISQIHHQPIWCLPGHNLHRTNNIFNLAEHIEHWRKNVILGKLTFYSYSWLVNCNDHSKQCSTISLFCYTDIYCILTSSSSVKIWTVADTGFVEGGGTTVYQLRLVIIELGKIKKMKGGTPKNTSGNHNCWTWILKLCY